MLFNKCFFHKKNMVKITFPFHFRGFDRTTRTTPGFTPDLYKTLHGPHKTLFTDYRTLLATHERLAQDTTRAAQNPLHRLQDSTSDTRDLYKTLHGPHKTLFTDYRTLLATHETCTRHYTGRTKPSSPTTGLY